MFRRIMATHPLDYYWFWTPEGWTWSGTKQKQIDATLADFRAAIAARRKVEAPFTLATCGWVLGPAQDRALFDNALPKEMPIYQAVKWRSSRVNLLLSSCTTRIIL
jgi:hypothetical protein